MEGLLLVNALKLSLHIGSWILGAMAIGAIISGVIRVVTQIEDPVIGLCGRFLGLIALFYIYADSFSKEIFQFALRIWSGADFYH